MDAPHRGTWIKAELTPEGRWIIGSVQLTSAHSYEACAGSPCVLHNPTRHNLSSYPMLWRDDRGIVERICKHGVGHPDPDEWNFWARRNGMYEQVHGCCGCCMPADFKRPVDTD